MIRPDLAAKLAELGRALGGRWRGAWREVAAATFAGLVAWLIVQRILGHAHPIFAAIIAIVVLVTLGRSARLPAAIGTIFQREGH